MNLPTLLLESPIVHRVGWALLHSLWQGVAIAALLWLSLAMLRKARAQTRYLAGLIAVFVAVVLPVATFVMVQAPGQSKSIAAKSSTSLTPPSAESRLTHSKGGAAARAVAPERVAPTDLDRIRASTELAQPRPAIVPVHRATAISLANIQRTVMIALASAAPWLVLVWLVGVLALSIWNLGAWVAVQHLKSLTTRPASVDVVATAVRLSNRLGMTRSVRLLQSVVIDSPLVIGMIKPVILLPASVLTDLPVTHLEALLAHEFAHVLRHDYLVNLLQSVVETLLFYHPAVWWISARIRIERENCCDDLAVAVTRDRATYVRALARVAGARTPVLAPAASGGELLPRLRRLMGKPDTDAVRPSRWLAGYAAAVLCVVGAVSSAVRSQVPPASPVTKPASTTQPSAARELRVRVVDAVTGEPVAGVHGSYTLDNSQSKMFEFDERGEFRIPLQPDTRWAYFFYRKEGFVERFVEFGRSENEPPIPAAYTARLTAGLLVGGVVQDEAGKPVAGAEVALTFRSDDNQAGGYGHAKTDENGRWTFHGAPDKPASIHVFTKHPDFVMSSFSHTIPGARFQELHEQRLITKIQRGISLSGSVRDEQGQPIANAEVTTDQFGLISGTKSDPQGHFVLGGVKPGERQIKAIADGFAPQMLAVTADKDAAPIDLVLKKGQLLRGRVVDRAGNPVANAALRLAQWRDVPNIGGFWARTDAEGRFTWNGAPDDAITLSVNKEGFQSVQLPVVANGQELQITISSEPAILVRGTVVDDETGKPIDSFIAHAEAQIDRMRSGHEATGRAGKYEIRLSEKGDHYLVRVRADGYLPAQSPLVAAGTEPLEFNLRLRKGKPFTGVLLEPDGHPAANADVVLHEIMAVQATNGRLQSSGSREVVHVKTDSAGQFPLPPREGQMKIVAIHDSGWLEFKQPAPSPPQHFTLHQWAKIEGRLLKGNQPVVGETVVLRPVVYADPITREVSALNSFRYEATTDDTGRFAFDRVVDGKVEMYTEHRDESSDRAYNGAHGYARTLDIQPGDQKTVQLGGSGCDVTGRLIIPQELKDKHLMPRFGELRLVAPQYIQPENFDSLTAEQRRQRRAAFEQSDAYRAYAARANTFMLFVQPDGHFDSDDVPPGDYVLNVNVQTPSPADPSNYRLYASATREVHVPDMPEGPNGQELDAGPIPMSLHHYLEAGADAPAFEARTFDGKTVKLSDLRGKYVLLDFWATWCAPCVAEFNELETLQHDFAGDDRFVILSISTDEHMAEPARFLQVRKLPWLQAFAGDLEESSARRAFGVQGIPSLWLIGPDGKILAKEIDEDKVAQTLKSALATH